jgi:predicted dehydrogenase
MAATPTRRGFVQGALATLATPGIARLRRRDDALGVAVAGLNGRGMELLTALAGDARVRIVALCDVDEQVLARAQRTLARPKPVDTHVDFRLLLERQDVEAVVVATPDHWHALQTVWACQAGKDVYLEGAVGLAVLEGERIVASARAHGRMVQSGLQQRSSAFLGAALEWFRKGELGRPLFARALCFTPQPSLGKGKKNQRIPDSIDYDLWCGPAPLLPLRRAHLHHDWRYSYFTGAGELATPGLHAIDLALRALGQTGAPSSVLAIGGRFGYDDDGETPNAQLLFCSYDPAPLLVELRGLPRDAASLSGDWGAAMDDVEGIRVGAIVHAEGGTLRLSADGAIAVDLAGLEVRRFEPEPAHGADDLAPHLGSWLTAIRSRRAEDLAAEIESARPASALVQLATVSQRLGLPTETSKVLESVISSTRITEGVERLLAHLRANGIELADGKEPADKNAALATKSPRPTLGLGPCLELDSFASCRGAADAARYLGCTYREPYVLPESV